MKKVLFIMNNLGGGGAERVLIDVLNSFDYSQYDVDLLLINCEGVYLKEVNENVNIIKLYRDKHFKNIYVEKLYHKIKVRLLLHFPKVMYAIAIRKKYDVEIAFLEGFPSTYLLANSYNRKSKKIAWVHTDLSKSRTLSFETEQEMYSKIDNIICVSEDSEEVVKNLYRDQSKKIKVIYNLIDKQAIIEKSKMSINDLGELPKIVSVGRLVHSKRFDLLIKAHKLLLEEGIRNKLIIVGSGEKEEEIKELVNELKVKETVEIVGFKSNPYPYIYHSEIFALASDYEGFSLVVAEALVLGKPIVSTRCVGPTELLNDGKYGILVDNNDEIKLKEALKSLLLNEEKRQHYSEMSTLRSGIFDKQSVMNKIYNIIDN